MNKDVLKYFYIREGKSKLLEYFQSTVNKKKQKKGVSSSIQVDGAPIQFNFFNFVQTNPIKKPRCFLNQQLINNLQGKGLEKKFSKDTQKPSIQSLQENLGKFQILHKKIVQKLTLEKSRQRMSPKKIKQILVIKKSLSLFANLFQDDDFSQRIKLNQELINGLKEKRLARYKQNSEKIRFSIFIFLDNINKNLQLRQLRQSYSSQNRITSEIQKDREVIQNKINFLISNCLEDIFTKLLDSVRLKQILTITKVKRNWEAAALLKQQNEIISKKITGKMLYSVQQTSTKLKAELKNTNTMREYYIRQKKHNFNTHNNSKLIKMIEFDTENISQKSNQSLQKNRSRNLSGVSKEISKRNYPQTIIQKPNNIKRHNNVQSKDKRTNQTQTIDQCTVPKYQKYYISNLLDLKSLPKKSPTLKSNLSQPIKPKYIKNFDINSLDQFAYNPSSQSNRNFGRTQPVTSYTNLKVFKYPIKIECFQILSPENSYLCYNVEEFSLKQLPLKFIKDRIEFKENKVKIEYPYNFSAEIEVKVAKSLQILTCLGAEVTCQMQSSYQHWNQIDEIQIMSASWVLEMPVKQVIDCYANFFCVNQTKK